jgi:cell shape-determining protein MreC
LLKKIIKRPYYYFFTTVFLIVVFLLSWYIVDKRLSNNKNLQINWIDKQFIRLNNSFLVRPHYVIADIFDILKFNIFTRGVEIRNLKIDYTRLKHEYALLKTENKRLSDIIKYYPTYGKIIATGRVLSDPNSFGVGVFTISVGLKNGVLFSDIVTTEYGLVGKIVKIYDETSVVLPVRHISAKTIGRIQNKGNLVLISGRHLKGGVVDYISSTVGLESNDQVLTVSDGVSMPSGIPIGFIMNPYDRPIKIKLAVNFATLDYVTVIRNENDNNMGNKKNKDIFNKKYIIGKKTMPTNNSQTQ